MSHIEELYLETLINVKKWWCNDNGCVFLAHDPAFEAYRSSLRTAHSDNWCMDDSIVAALWPQYDSYYATHDKIPDSKLFSKWLSEL